MEWKKTLAFTLAVAMVGTMMPISALAVENAAAGEKQEEAKQKEEAQVGSTQAPYQLYPIPHALTYEKMGTKLGEQMDVVFEDGIDTYTEQRAGDALEEVRSGMNKVETAEEAKLLVGIYNNADTKVDDWFKNQLGTQSARDFEVLQKTDSYLLLVRDGKIGVLGKDTDSAFYGLTTLRQILQQTDPKDKVIRNLFVKDWADVASRGFIEGYYGEPWSTEDRAELMRWGGNVKLNSYFYAPKDDPKHNKKWREKYTDAELKEKIEPLAKAGNASKCQFVFALHPFMNDPITKENYAESVQILKEKFEQVISAGVRQIAVLADDAADQGSDLYIKLMTELVEWVSSPEMQEKYAGLKTTIPFCPVQYMGLGEDWMKQMPEQVPIVMTGGMVWGEVTDGFTNAYFDNVQRGPYMWINWPCSDNSKNHLIMGGYADFLHPGVSPDKIQGIVLNPMQQSEPSKAAIFGNACYAWHIWDEAQAKQAWEDAFSYVDHDTHEDTEASEALREISKHMINQNMTNGVVTLQESVELKPKMDAFKSKLSAETVTQADLDEMRAEFRKLAQAAETFRTKGNQRIAKQIVYWLDSWKNVTAAVDGLMDALEAYYIKNDAASVPTLVLAAQSQLEEAGTHGFSYLDHTEYAEVGVQHIMPFVRAVRDHAAKLAQLSVDPSAVIPNAITNRTDAPQGLLSNLVDGKENTEVVFKEGDQIRKGDYLGVRYKNPVHITDVKFVMGRAADHTDTFDKAQLMYTEDGSKWLPVPNVEPITDGSAVIEAHGLDLHARGIRLEATAAKKDSWLAAREIYVNDVPLSSQGAIAAPLAAKVVKSPTYKPSQGTVETALSDSNDDSFVWYAGNAKKDDFVGMQLDGAKPIGNVHIVVGKQGSQDKWMKYHIEYSENGTSDWKTVPKEQIKVSDGVSVDDAGQIRGQGKGKDVIDLDLRGTRAKTIRVYNDEAHEAWSQFGGFEIYAYDPATVFHSENWKTEDALAALTDGADDTAVQFTQGSSAEGDFVGLKLPAAHQVGKVRFVIGGEDGGKWSKYHLEYAPSESGDDWVRARTFTGAESGRDVVEVNLDGVTAHRVRLVNDAAVSGNVSFSEITVERFDASHDLSRAVWTSRAENKAQSYGELTDEGFTLSRAFAITLQAGEYYGVRLPRIRQVGEITVKGQGLKGLTLKTAVNMQESRPYEKGSVEARYIYLQNDTNAPITFELEELNAKITETKPIQFDSITGLELADAGRDAVAQGTADQLFDGNVNTHVTFARTQTNNGAIVYDLGKTQPIQKIEALMRDTERDFLRQGVIEVARSKEGPWTPVVTINAMGAGGDTANDDTAGSAGWGQSSSRYPNFKSWVGTLHAPVDARYLRIRVTGQYSHRWINFSELLLNDQTYIPQLPQPTIKATPAEQSGEFLPAYAIDGNVATGFKPNMPQTGRGVLAYQLSEQTEIDRINILQSSAHISNAEVWVRGILAADGENAKSKWVQVGVLREPLTSMDTSGFRHIFEIKLGWDNVTPIIYEIAPIARAAEKAEK